MKLLALGTFVALTAPFAQACGLTCNSDQHCVDYGPYDVCAWNDCGPNQTCPSGHTCNGYQCVRNPHCDTNADCPTELRCLYINTIYQKKCWDPNVPTTCTFPNDCAAWGAICVPMDPAPGTSYQCIYPDDPHMAEAEEDYDLE